MSSDEENVVICRCCLVECEEYRSLYREGILLGEVTTLAALLTFCTSLDFDEEKQGKTLPTVVCNNCIQDIARSYLFKKKVLESYEALRSHLINEAAHVENGTQEEIKVPDNGDANENGKLTKGLKAFAKRKSTETDLEELAAAAQMKREIAEQLCDAEEECDNQLPVIDNNEDEVEVEVANEAINDDDSVEYVVQEVADTTVIYQTTTRDHGKSVEEEVEEMVKVDEYEGEVQYEIHTHEIVEDNHETITGDTVNVDNLTSKKVSRNRNRTDKKIPNPNFQCQECGKQLSNSSSFKYHMQLHSDETPYKCDVCDESFKTRNAYDGHKRTHDPNNPNTCHLCGKSYRQPSSLRIHMLSHSGEKPFVCNICGKSLTQKSGYKKHMLTHTGEKPYPCDICGKAFRISSNMLAHRRSHAGEKPHSCVECEKSFGTFEQLKRHMLVHSEQKSFTCEVCGKQFKRQSTLRTHSHCHCYNTPDPASLGKKICKSNVVEII